MAVDSTALPHASGKPHEGNDKTPRLTIPYADDLAFGQIVIVTARWILVLAGFLLALWNPGKLSELQVVLGFVLVLAVCNFFLHARLLMKRSQVGNAVIAYGTSIADMTIISIIIAALGGARSSLYIFYYPAILGFSVAFRPAVTYLLAGAGMLTYAVIILSTSTLADADLQAALVQLLMMAAVAVCGSVYWRIERDRRAEAAKARAGLMAQIREHSNDGQAAGAAAT
jgi:hypothetical protein